MARVIVDARHDWVPVVTMSQPMPSATPTATIWFAVPQPRNSPVTTATPTSVAPNQPTVWMATECTPSCSKKRMTIQ